MAQDGEQRQLGPSIIRHAKVAYETQQSRQTSTDLGNTGLDGFLRKLTAPESGASLPIPLDTSHPISQYFISSSHNTYLSGNQLWSKSSTEAYKNVLKRGCRCVEIDIWDGESPANSSSESDDENAQSKHEEGEVGKLRGLMKKGLGKLHSRNASKEMKPIDSPAADTTAMPTPWRSSSGRAEPRVLHGYTATKEVPFRKVAEIIREYAFRTTDLPLIVSLEIHLSPEQQEILVEIINHYWRPYLVDVPADLTDDTPLPSLESLRKRILIKVKYSPPKKASKAKKLDEKTSKEPSRNDSSSDEDEAQVDTAKKGKIIDTLSGMGTYTKSCHFKAFDQPEAAIPTHVFALSEKKLISLQESDAETLFQHNMQFFMRAYPRGTRVRSTNLDPAPFWRQGVQMVALNWQQFDASMMLNDAMFADGGGWVLKPEGYRQRNDISKSLAKPHARKTALNLKINLLGAQSLGSEGKTSKPYVKCELHVESSAEKRGEVPKGGKTKDGEWKRRSSVGRSRDPDFGGEALKFLDVEDVDPELSFVRFKVMDDDSFQKDAVLGYVAFRLDRFPTGLRLLSLKGLDGKPNGGLLLIDSQMEEI